MPPLIGVALFWACAAACVAGEGALLAAAIRRSPSGRELTWAVLPAVALALLLGATWTALPR